MYSNGKQKENENNRSNDSLDLDMIKNLINNSVPNRIQGFNIGQLPPPPMLNIPKTPAVPAPVRLNNAQEQQSIQSSDLIKELESLIHIDPQLTPAINDRQLEQIRPQNQTQQEQEESQEEEEEEEENEDIFAILGEAQAASEKEEMIKRLLEMLPSLEHSESLYNDDIFNAWKLYLDIAEKGESQYNRGIREVTLLFNYMKESNHVSPDSNDILECLKQYCKEHDVTFDTMYVCKLMTLKRFFKWTEYLSIYSNITKGISKKNIREIYGGETNKRNNRRTNRQTNRRTNLVQKLRKKGQDELENYGPDTTLNPAIIDTYLRTCKLKDRECFILNEFKKYLMGFSIRRPTPRTITQFMISPKIRRILIKRGTVKNCSNIFKNFFNWTSRTRDANGNTLYPNIGDCLDKIDWIDCLLSRIDPNHQGQDTLDKSTIDSLMSDLNIDESGNHLDLTHPRLF